jgi:hypothetical protein
MFKPKEKYKVAYHYTGLEGFLGITESRSFWLTNAYYLNDKNEIKWPIEMAIRHFNADPDNNKELIKYLSYLKSNIFDIYLISFTYNKNLLSQWRAYTNKGNGVSIGIEMSKLETIANDNGLHLINVIYDNDKHIDIIEMLKREFIARVHNNVIPYAELNNIFLSQLVRIKSREFQEEEEVRLVSDYFEKYTDSRIKYKSKPNLLIPYIEIEFKKYANPVFEEIIVGPCQHFELNWKSIQNRLSATGLCNLTASSQSSFRSFE